MSEYDETYSLAEQARVLVNGRLLAEILRELRAECFDQFCADIDSKKFTRIMLSEATAGRMLALTDIVDRIQNKAREGIKEHGEG